MPPVHGHRGDDHDGNQECGADGSKEAERDEQTATDLAERGGCGERGAGVEAKLSEELAGPAQAVASEPPKEFLGSVACHDEPDGDPQEQDPDAECLWVDCVRTHGVVPSNDIGYYS